jgi:hypothetical protein
MAATLSSLTDRVEALVMDIGNRIFDTSTIAEGIRLALGEYNLARESAALAPVTLSGLDGAALTTLDSGHESLLVLGGAGYAAAARAVDRAESFELDKEARDLTSWAEKRLAEFRAMLRSIHPAYGGAISGGTGGEMDPGLLAATIAHLDAQADALIGQESRAAAAAVQAASERAAEAARLADLRGAAVPPWGRWEGEV